MKLKEIKNKLLMLTVIGISVLGMLFVITCSWIGYEVKAKCKEAVEGYGGDCVESLSALVRDENKGYRARNSAVWALGQLGDGRALTVLEEYYTGNIPAREPLDKVISQYELKKAINLAKGGLNISAWVWRWGK